MGMCVTEVILILIFGYIKMEVMSNATNVKYSNYFNQMLSP